MSILVIIIITAIVIIIMIIIIINSVLFSLLSTLLSWYYCWLFFMIILVIIIVIIISIIVVVITILRIISSDYETNKIISINATRPSHTQIFDPSIACRYLYSSPSVYPVEFERHLFSTLGLAQQKQLQTLRAKLTPLQRLWSRVPNNLITCSNL